MLHENSPRWKTFLHWALGGSDLDSVSGTSLVWTFVSNLTSFYSDSVAEGRRNRRVATLHYCEGLASALRPFLLPKSNFPMSLFQCL